jgi:hypothetical protein
MFRWNNQGPRQTEAVHLDPCAFISDHFDKLAESCALGNATRPDKLLGGETNEVLGTAHRLQRHADPKSSPNLVRYSDFAGPALNVSKKLEPKISDRTHRAAFIR